MEEKVFPTVFAIGDRYQIVVYMDFKATVALKIGEKIYYDDANGVLRSDRLIHSIEIPMSELDGVGQYTVIYRKMIDRKPYFPESAEPVELTFNFRPITIGNINIYHIADAHNMEQEPIEAGGYFGDDLDLLVLNGDIPNHSGDINNFNSIYRIAYRITKGEIPVVFARGNHDTRGIYAEFFSDYTPNDLGKTYYTFKLGHLWGMVLDCGEDKSDSHEEYGNTVCFHNFRLKETEFIKSVIADAENEYNYADIKHRIIVCHIPFMEEREEPFNIEEDLYKEWTELICKNIKPDIMLFGHTHQKAIYMPGGDYDRYGCQNCPIIIGSEPDFNKKTFIGCGITLSNKEPKIVFNDNKMNIIE